MASSSEANILSFANIDNADGNEGGRFTLQYGAFTVIDNIYNYDKDEYGVCQVILINRKKISHLILWRNG